MKELNEIRTKGTPPGIELLSADSMMEWVFSIAVLGDETIYRVNSASTPFACSGRELARLGAVH